MLKDTKKKEEEGDVKARINKGVELMLQRKEASSPKKFNLKQFIQGSNVLAIALTFGTLVAVLFLCVGGIIGWLAQQNKLLYPHQYEQVAYAHPEMFDEHGNLIPDEILALRFENNYDDSEEDTDEEE